MERVGEEGWATRPSLFAAALTYSPGTTLVPAGRESFKLVTTKVIARPTFAGNLATAAVQEGTLSAGTAASVQGVSTAVGKVAVLVAAVATGLLGGFVGACWPF